MQKHYKKRADLNRNIEQLRSRLRNNVLVQEGEQPAEDPIKLKMELDNSIKRLNYLIAHINQTNCIAKINELSLNRTYSTKRCPFFKNKFI